MTNGTTLALAALSAAVLASSAALPTTAAITVQTATRTIPTANPHALSPLPSTIASDVKSFLSSYQPDAAAAATHAAIAHFRDFPDEGLCTQPDPCFSVSRVGFAHIQDQSALTIPQMDELLHTILSKPEVTFDRRSDPDTILIGTKIETSNLTLKVIARAGHMPSSLLAGTVFDLFKAQGLGSESNAVRGLGVGGGEHDRSVMGLCVYPSGTNSTTAINFCYGKELDGTHRPTSPSTPANQKRGISLEGIVAGFCGLVDVPLLCPS